MNQLKKDYEKACNAYIKAFCKKQDVKFYGWIGDLVGSVALLSEICLNIHDIVWDINSKQPKGLIFTWYYDNLENAEKSINYFSYTKGLRIKDI